MTTYNQSYNEHPQNFNVWEKVLHPNRVLPQMTSDTLQPRFFFGGSQVPISLEGYNKVGAGISSHKFKSNYENSICKAKGLKESEEQRAINRLSNAKKYLGKASVNAGM